MCVHKVFFTLNYKLDNRYIFQSIDLILLYHTYDNYTINYEESFARSEIRSTYSDSNTDPRKTPDISDTRLVDPSLKKCKKTY